MTGRMYPERWGFLSAALVFAGFFMTFFPQFLLGNAGMPRRYYNYDPQFQTLHVISTVGSWILGAGMTFTLGYLVVALFTRPSAPGQPVGLALLRVAHALAAAEAQLRARSRSSSSARTTTRRADCPGATP